MGMGQVSVQFLAGLETIIVMMKTTLLNVNMMEEIVVIMKRMVGTNIVKFVNVLSFQKQLKPLMDQIVRLLIGLVMIIVMMKTTMLNAGLMVEIVVEMMSIHSIVKLVNVLNFQKQLKALMMDLIVHFLTGLETIIVMMKTTLLNVDLMEEIVVIMKMMAGTTGVKNVNVLNFQKQL